MNKCVRNTSLGQISINLVNYTDLLNDDAHHLKPNKQQSGFFVFVFVKENYITVKIFKEV